MKEVSKKIFNSNNDLMDFIEKNSLKLGEFKVLQDKGVFKLEYLKTRLKKV